MLAILFDGAAAGLIVGLTYGAWAVWLNHDVAHRMFVLAFLRVSGSAFPAIGGGMLLSLLLATLLGMCARRRPQAAWGASAVAIALPAVAAMLALAFRERVLPMHYFNSRIVTIGIVALLLGAVEMLVLVRIADVLRNGGSPGRLSALVRRLRAAGRPIVAIAIVALIAGRFAIPSAGQPSETAYSILLVSIDTLRADRLGVLGGTRDLTPGLDRLAREGALFTAAESTAPWTLPAHVSLFTSQLPWDHRVQALGIRIPPGRNMLAERFLDAGYRTGGFTAGGYLDDWYGFAQGFQTFAVHQHADGVGTEPIVAAALEWIVAAPERPFFAFVHTYAPHVPYIHAALTDPRDAGRLAGQLSWQDFEAIRRGTLVLTPAERRYVTDLYDGGIAYADQALGRLFEELRRSDVLDRTIVVVLSDHGEELWDHGSLRSPDHGHSLYDELTRVPLIVRAPGLVRPGTRIDRPVSLIDVAPTLLHLAGLPLDDSYAGRDLTDAIRSGVEPAAQPVFFESTQVGPDRFGLRVGDTKAIVAPRPGTIDGVSAPPLEIFDLAADAAETQPTVSASDDATRMLMALLEARARNMIDGEGHPPALPVPDDVSKRLRALGYVD